MATFSPEAVVAQKVVPTKLSDGDVPEGSARGSPAQRRSREFRANSLLLRPNTTEADIPGKRGPEQPPRPEFIQFSKRTDQGHTRLLDNWATNMMAAYDKPGGHSLFEKDPNAVKLYQIVLEADKRAPGESDDVRHARVMENINAMLNTTKGWEAASGLLDQTTADGLFVMGLMVSSKLAEKGVDPNSILGEYQTEDQQKNGWWRRRGRRAKNIVMGHPKTIGVAGGATLGQVVGRVTGEPVAHDIKEAALFLYQHLHDIPHSESSLLSYGLGAAGLGIGWYLDRQKGEGPPDDRMFQASKDALLAIQSDSGHAARIKALIKVDVNDFYADEETGTIKVREHPQSTAKLTDVLDGVASNIETRKHYYADLGVPESEIDAMAELFILQHAQDGYERNGVRLTSEITERFLQLKKEYRRIPTETEPSDEKKKAALVLDRSGRGFDDPLRGRGYPKDVTLPEYDPTRLLNERLDIWYQTSLDPDPTRDEVLRVRGSQFYGRVDEASVHLLDSEDITIVNSEGSSQRLRDRLLRRSTRPDALLTPKLLKDAKGRNTAEPETRVNAAGQREVVYLYEARNSGQEISLSADQIFYIDNDGKRHPLADVRAFNNGVFDYPGDNKNEVMQNSFYIPTNGGPPLPLSMLNSIARLDENADWIDVDKYVCRKGKTGKTEVSERVFTGIDRNGNKMRLPSIPSTPANLETFLRDKDLQAPLGEPSSEAGRRGNFYPLESSEAPGYGRVREQYLSENLLTLFPPGTEISSELARKGIHGVYEAIQTGRLPLRGELRPQDLQDFFRGEEIPAAAQQILESAFPDKDVVLGPTLLVSDEQFLARDAERRSPADIRFGITDPDILAALDKLEPASLKFFDPDTGLDKWGQGPGDTLFCRANRKEFSVGRKGGVIEPVNLNEAFDLDSIVIDQWGQEKKLGNGEPNPFFMVQNETEFNEEQLDLVLYREAQQMVLSDVAEELIVQMRRIPPQDISILEQKEADRDPEGRVRRERREQRMKDKPALEDMYIAFGRRAQEIEDYEQAKNDLAEARKALPKYIADTFGAGVNTDEKALELIEAVRYQTETSIKIKVDGKEKPIHSILQRRKNLDTEYNKAYAAVPVTNQPGATEQREAYDKRLDRIYQTIDAEFQRRYDALNEDDRTLERIELEIKRQQDVIKENEKIVEPNRSMATERDGIIYSRDRAYRDHARRLNQNPELRALLLKGTPDAILEKIHQMHADESSLGWEAADDEDGYKQQLLYYTMTLAKAEVEDAGSIRAFNDREDVLNEILLQGVTFVQLEEMEVSALEPQLSSFTAVQLTELPEIKQDVINYRATMERATTAIRDDMGLRVRRLDRLDTKDEISDKEKDKISLIIALANRQEIIFNAPELFMAGVDQFLPVVEKEKRSRTFDDLLDSEKNEKRTNAERKVGEENPAIPLGYYEVMDVLFGYKNRADKEEYFAKIHELVSPAMLHEIMSEAAANSQLPIKIPKGDNLGEFFYSLRGQIEKKLVNKQALRQMFVGVIDSLKAQAMAMA